MDGGLYVILINMIFLLFGDTGILSLFSPFIIIWILLVKSPTLFLG